MFSIESSAQRENLNAIFVSDNIENLDELVNAFANTIINDIRYEINAATLSDAQVEFAGDPDKITHTSNGITRPKSFNCRTIGIRQKEASVLPPLVKPRIGAIIMAPHALKLPAVQEIFTYAASKNTVTNRTLWRISKTAIDRTTSVHSGISETSNPDPSDNSGNSINGIN